MVALFWNLMSMAPVVSKRPPSLKANISKALEPSPAAAKLID